MGPARFLIDGPSLPASCSGTHSCRMEDNPMQGLRRLAAAAIGVLMAVLAVANGGDRTARAVTASSRRRVRRVQVLARRQLRGCQGQDRQALDVYGSTESAAAYEKAHRLALGRPGDLAVPHHAPAAHERADRPALHADAVVGRPAAARLDPGVGDGLAALQVDDGEVRVVADRNAALAADAEQPVGAVARQIDEALQASAARH